MKSAVSASIAAAFGVLTITCLQTSVRAQDISGAEAGWTAILKCGGIANDVRRHACTDEVLRRAGAMPTPEAQQAERRKTFGLERPASSPPPPPPPAPPATVTQSVAASPVAVPTAAGSTAPAAAPSAPSLATTAPQRADVASVKAPQSPKEAAAGVQPDSDDRITVTLKQVVLGGDGKLELTTQEGVVWRQVENIPIRPTPATGQAMTIRKTAMGGFMCMPSKWVSFRCYRLSN